MMFGKRDFSCWYEPIESSIKWNIIYKLWRYAEHDEQSTYEILLWFSTLRWCFKCFLKIRKFVLEKFEIWLESCAHNKVLSCLIHIFIDSENFSIYSFFLFSSSWINEEWKLRFFYPSNVSESARAYMNHDNKFFFFERSGVCLESQESGEVWIIFKSETWNSRLCTHMTMKRELEFSSFDRNRFRRRLNVSR